MTTIMPSVLDGIEVCSLMEVDMNKWDDDILLDICNERDRNLMKRIPLLTRARKESWFWLFDDRGHFTVKSCYNILQGGTGYTDAHFWKKLLSLKLPSKVIIFLWRVCTLCLPTTTRLLNKRIQINTICKWCHVYHEINLHVLFDYTFANAVLIDV